MASSKAVRSGIFVRADRQDPHEAVAGPVYTASTAATICGRYHQETDACARIAMAYRHWRSRDARPVGGSSTGQGRAGAPHIVGRCPVIDHLARGGADEVILDSSIGAGDLQSGTLVSLVSATRHIRRRLLHRKLHRLADRHRRIADATFRGLANLGDYDVRFMFRQNKNVRVA